MLQPMQRHLWGWGRGITLLTLTLLAALALLPTFGQSGPVFRIGVIDEAGGDLLQGAQLAVQRINEAGGVRGADGTLFRLEIIQQADADISAAVDALDEASVIAVVGPQSASDVLSNLTALQSLGVPILTPALDDTLLAVDTSERIVRIRAQEVLQGRALANYVVNDLGARDVATIQLDVESTAGVVGFTTALASQGVNPSDSFLLSSDASLTSLIQDAVAANPDFIAIYGPPTTSATTYLGLRAANYTGDIYYRGAGTSAFRDELPDEQLPGVYSSTTWSYAASDASSQAFVLAYTAAFGEVPGPVSAASYDAVNLLATAIGAPGDLLSNLLNINDYNGVQGTLDPAALTDGETSTNVTITRLGTFGAPQPVARYLGSVQIDIDDSDSGTGVISPGPALPTIAPPATATPDGVFLTVTRQIQNVRTGPGLVYDVLGQLREGDQVRVVGANVDFTWYAIEFRGQTAWLSPGEVDIFGDRSSIPLLAAPPTPTPPPATPTPTPQPLPDIIITSASPNRITIGQPFSVVVNVLNQGGANAGPFAVATNLQPGSVFSSFTFNNGLAAGQSASVTLNGTLNGATGPQNVVIVADLNRQVEEGPQGEANTESFVYTYVADRAIQTPGGLAQLIVQPGSAVTLDAGNADINWTGQELVAQNNARINLINNISSVSNVHYDAIDASLNASPIPVSLLPAGRLVGFVTDQGQRGVLRIDNVLSGGNLTISYRVYAP